MKSIGAYGLCGLFIVTGLSHLLHPDIFVRIIPPVLPYPFAIAILSGIFELILAAGFAFPNTRIMTAWATIVFLIAIFPANIYMYLERKTQFSDIPGWALLIRLPLQFVLIAIVYTYTNTRSKTRP